MSLESLKTSLEEIIKIFMQPFVMVDELDQVTTKFEMLKKEFEEYEKRLKVDSVDATESTALLKKSKDHSQQQLLEIERLITEIANKIASANKACKRSKEMSAVSESRVMSFEGDVNPFPKLPDDVKKIIFEFLPLNAKLNLRAASKGFRDLLNDSWVTERAMLFTIGDRQLIKFIEQSEVITSETAIKLIDIISKLRNKKTNPRVHVIAFVRTQINQELDVFNGGNENNLCRSWVGKSVIWSWALFFLLLFGGTGIFLYQATKYKPKAKDLVVFIPAALVALYAVSLLICPNVASSACANVRYGRFFSSAPLNDEENPLSTAGVRDRFYADASVPVVESHPQASVNADDEEAPMQMIVDGEEYYDADDNLGQIMTCSSTAALRR